MSSTKTLQGGLLVDAVSMAANITSGTLDVQGAGVAGVQFVAASATHVGAWTVELSIDGSTWDATGFELSDGTRATSVSASNGSALAELVRVPVGHARHLRCVYTFSSGIGTAYVYALKKALAGGTAGTSSMSGAVTVAQLPASVGVKAVAASLSVAMGTEDAAKVPALGVAASAASSPVVLASDDAHLGAVGAAADADGVLHGQLYYLATKIDALLAQIYVPDLTVAPTSVTVGTSSAAIGTSLVVGGKYLLYATVPCWVKVGADAGAAAVTDIKLEVGDRWGFTVTANDTDDNAFCISDAAGGKAYCQRCKA
jgi:hypothetical protein